MVRNIVMFDDYSGAWTIRPVHSIRAYQFKEIPDTLFFIHKTSGFPLSKKRVADIKRAGEKPVKEYTMTELNTGRAVVTGKTPDDCLKEFISEIKAKGVPFLTDRIQYAITLTQQKVPTFNELPLYLLN